MQPVSPTDWHRRPFCVSDRLRRQANQLLRAMKTSMQALGLRGFKHRLAFDIQAPALRGSTTPKFKVAAMHRSSPAVLLILQPKLKNTQLEHGTAYQATPWGRSLLA